MQHKQSSPVYILRFIAFLLFIGSIGFIVRSGLSGSPKRPLCRRCNVILIAIDNLRADALPCYGYERNTAPNICTFAGQNILFSRAYANSSWTLPSEVSLFTGLYPTSHGMGTGMRDILNPAVNTLPKILQANGYMTTAVTNIQPNVGLEQGLGRGFTNVRFTQDAPDQAMPVLLEAIDAIKTANNQHKPAFVYFHTDGVHYYNNNIPDAPAYYPLDPGYRLPEIPKDAFAFTKDTWDIMRDRLNYIVHVDPIRNTTHPYATWYEQTTNAKTVTEAKAVFDALPPQDSSAILWESSNYRIRNALGDAFVPLTRHLYDQALYDVDRNMLDVFQRLEKLRLLRNTIVIITAEHGEFLGERGLIGHGETLYDTETHVPLILRVPTIRPTRVSSLVSLMDLFPTILDLVGIRHTAPKSSVSHVQALQKDPSALTRGFVIAEWKHAQWGNIVYGHKSIRTDRWHLLETKTQSGAVYELYDVVSDPSELMNVADTNLSVVNMLTNTLHATLDAQPVYTPTITSFPDWIDEEHRRKLIETGYF